VDCGFLARRRVRDGAVVTLTEFERGQLAQRYLDEAMVCFAEFDGFRWDGVRVTITCPFYMQRVLGRSPSEHFAIQGILNEQRRALRFTIAVSVGMGLLTIAAVIVAALIGRGAI